MCPKVCLDFLPGIMFLILVQGGGPIKSESGDLNELRRQRWRHLKFARKGTRGEEAAWDNTWAEVSMRVYLRFFFKKIF